MAKLTDVRDTPEIANGAKVVAVPVKGGTTIYQGALVALDASGYAIPGKKAESLTAVGRAEETVTNTGADGELVIRVARGVFVFDNTATAANKITAAHVLKPCYMEDDHTVSPSSRRAWIEIVYLQHCLSSSLVALLAEGVDRNICASWS